jgi:hypothetical protein
MRRRLLLTESTVDLPKHSISHPQSGQAIGSVSKNLSSLHSSAGIKNGVLGVGRQMSIEGHLPQNPSRLSSLLNSLRRYGTTR